MTSTIASKRGVAENHQSPAIANRGITSLGRNLILVVACLLTAKPLAMMAQTSSEQKLTQAYELEREGKAAPAIKLVKALLDSGSLNRECTAKAWNILGLASKDAGDFVASRRAFEQSLETYEGLPGVARDYAAALDDFAELYVLSGQLDLAETMTRRALQLYESTEDHAGAARASNYLTGVLLSQKKVREGRKTLQRAIKESRLTSNLDDDDLATLVFLQGWVANLDGDLQTSESRYQQSLELLRRYHGEEHASTGWAYVVAGKAHAEAGDLSASLAEMRKGVAILGRTLSEQDPRLLTAETAYSRVLEAAGRRSEAQLLRTDAEGKLKAFRLNQCAECSVSAKVFGKPN